jgi:hypothetical protein
MCCFLGGPRVALGDERNLTRVIARETPRWRTSPGLTVRGFAPIPGGPSTPATASWLVWHPARTYRLALPRRRRSRLSADLTCSPLRRPRCCFEWRGSSSTHTHRRSAAGVCSEIADRGASHAASCSRADRRSGNGSSRHAQPATVVADASEPARSRVRRCSRPSPAARRAERPCEADELRSGG